MTRWFPKVLSMLAVCIWFWPPAVQSEYKRINKPNPNDSMAVHIYRLENGLTVYLTENHEKPRIYTEIAVRAGSKHDPPDNTGMAHYQEHLMSKGNHRLATTDFEKEKPHLDKIVALYEEHFKEEDPEKRKAIYARINKESQLASQYSIPREHDKIWKAMGGSGRNAHTWLEETVYKVDIPANRLKHWVVLESERFVNPVFRMFQTELEVVYEEKNRSLDDKQRLIFDAVNRTLFKSHPYGQQTTIGTVEHLKNPSLKTMYEFYRKNYVPGNMAIVLSGDFKVAEAIQMIDAHFSSWEAREVPQQQTWQEAPLGGAERVTVKYKGEARVLLAFRTVPRNHKDAEALRLIDMILDNSTAGLINLNLSQKQRVRGAGSYPYFHNDYGAQYLYGIPKQGQSLEEVENLLLDQLKLVKDGAFEDWILPAIVTDFKKDRKGRLESNNGRVRFISDVFIGFKEWDQAIAEISRMEKVTKDDIVRVANTYFGENYVAGYRVDEQHEIPKIEKPVIDKIKIDPSRQSPYAVELLAMPVDEIEPVYVDPETDYEVSNYYDGVELYYSRNPINALFSLTLTFEVGNNQDNRMAMASLLLDKSGAGDISADDLKKEWYKIGTSFSIRAGNNETSVTISGLDENLGASLRLMVELLKHPVAEPATLEALVKITIGKREDAKKDHRQVRSAVVHLNRHGEESKYLRMLSSEELKQLTISGLHRAIANLFTYKHTISYTGSLSPDALSTSLREYHTIEGSLEDPPPYKFLVARDPTVNEIYFF
jgi:predicted Zn-dependent peptidase